MELSGQMKPKFNVEMNNANEHDKITKGRRS